MKHSNPKTTEENYWQSMADSLVALLLCVLLIMLLLMLYLVRIDENHQIDDQPGDSYQKYEDPEDGGGNHGYGLLDNQEGDTYNREDGQDDGGVGGWGGYVGDWQEGNGDGEEDFQFEDPDPGAGEGIGLDRAAVLVQVIDSETERTIKKEGITFELYKDDAVLQVLNTYYPKKISYKQFKTDSSGVFYLPERLVADTYYLQSLTTIPGYDIGEGSSFTIDRAYDWEAPFVVNVRLQPSKNVIELQLTDSSDGKSVSGAAFQIIAAENITTADGTLRFQENALVDTVTIGSDGKGRSQELFLGSYLVRQTGIPEYYGKIEEKLVSLKTRSDNRQREAVNLYTEKTSMEISLVDELLESIPLTGVRFSLCNGGGEVLQQLTTDAQGKLKLRNLNKNTTYTLRQESAPDGYRMQQKDLSFRVSADGFIDGSVSAERTITNRTARISIAVQDKLFRNYVSDVNLALMDAEGNILKSWSSTGLEQTFEGIDQGQYKLVMGGNLDNAVAIQVEDTAQIQEFRLERWTTVDIAVLISAAALTAGLLVLLAWLLKRKKSKGEGSDA